jgi:hypothetical protein
MAKIFAINDDLVSKSLEGLTDEQLWTRPTARNNPMMWLVGHVVETRTQLMALLGEPFETGWGQQFVRGATLRDATQYPSREDIQHVMSDVSRRLHTTLATLDDEQMNRPPAVQSPGAETVADQVAGFALHDCYHVGQIGYIRKALGYPALAV